MLTDTQLQQCLDMPKQEDGFVSIHAIVLAEIIRELMALRKKQPKPTTTASLLGGERP